MKPEKRKGQRAVILGIIILVLLGMLLVALDWHNVRQLAGEANWKLSLFAILFVAITYLFLSYGFVVVNRVSRLVIRRNIKSSLSTFDKSMTVGVAAIKNRPLVLAPVLALIVADWASSVAVLWFC